MKSAQFTRIVKSGDKDKLAAAFYELGESLFTYFARCRWFQCLDRDDALQELIMYAFGILPRFDPEKGKALDFFSSAMSGWIRCNLRAYEPPRPCRELEEKYREFLTDRDDDDEAGNTPLSAT